MSSHNLKLGTRIEVQEWDFGIGRHDKLHWRPATIEAIHVNGDVTAQYATGQFAHLRGTDRDITWRVKE